MRFALAKIEDEILSSMEAALGSFACARVALTVSTENYLVTFGRPRVAPRPRSRILGLGSPDIRFGLWVYFLL